MKINVCTCDTDDGRYHSNFCPCSSVFAQTEFDWNRALNDKVGEEDEAIFDNQGRFSARISPEGRSDAGIFLTHASCRSGKYEANHWALAFRGIENEHAR